MAASVEYSPNAYRHCSRTSEPGLGLGATPGPCAVHAEHQHPAQAQPPKHAPPNSHPLTPELPAYTSAIHPTAACWAWAGRGSKLALRPIDSAALAAAADDEGDSAAPGAGALGGEGSVIDTGKGKFGMAVEFVSSR